jgi:hypothetical protein
MENAELEQYFREQQVAPQWLLMLRALAQELGERADVADLRQLWAGVGERAARDVAEQFVGINTLPDLEQAFNATWQHMNWGWVRFQEQGEAVDIFHYCAPLVQAFGEDAVPWSIGILEGFYHHIFSQLGADSAMQVQAVGYDGMNIQLRFGR